MSDAALLRRVDQALAGRTPAQALAARSFATGSRLLALADEGLAAMREGRRPSDAQRSAVRHLLTALRPAWEVEAGWPDHPGLDATFPGWSEARPSLQALAAAVVRVDEPGGEPIGTAFAVDGELLATARHVADVVSAALVRGSSTCRIGGERVALAVAAVHPWLDLALLRAARPHGLSPVALAAAPVEPAWLAVVGYPSSPNRDEDAWLWSGPFGVLRVSAGLPAGRWDLRFEHDATTLGGSSGSPVWGWDQRAVVGVHTSSVPGVRNVAASAIELRALVEAAR